MTKLFRKKIGTFFRSLLTKWLEDFFVLLGISILLMTTYQQFGNTIGNYSLGFVLLVTGFLLAKK